MRFIVKATTGALLALALATGAASAKDWTATTVRIGTDATYPPFESQDSGGNIVGFDIDIGNAVCAEVKLKCEFSNQDWDGIIPALQAGKIDAILSSMSITEERLKQIDFTDKVYNTPPALVVPKDSDITSADPAALAGKSIGVQSSTTHAAYAEKFYKDAEIKYYKTAEERNLDLASGRLDAGIDDVVVFTEWLATPDGACCKIGAMIKPVPEIHGKGAGIGVRKEDTDLKELFNKGLAAIRANGKYKEINDKYFKFDAYGG
ncbi:MAG TPA: lysine/arginine/ornithine ABC transporter substrate-binding protein [Bauldia sp.]|nr:lysine/arginine/ornithine ABC transporter substrate-binding protein [Bauldia sp.]